jgi:hypothetical protein
VATHAPSRASRIWIPPAGQGTANAGSTCGRRRVAATPKEAGCRRQSLKLKGWQMSAKGGGRFLQAMGRNREPHVVQRRDWQETKDSLGHDWSQKLVLRMRNQILQYRLLGRYRFVRLPERSAGQSPSTKATYCCVRRSRGRSSTLATSEGFSTPRRSSIAPPAGR